MSVQVRKMSAFAHRSLVGLALILSLANSAAAAEGSDPVILECLPTGGTEPFYWRVSDNPAGFERYSRDLRAWTAFKCESSEPLAFGPATCTGKISETEYSWDLIAVKLNEMGLARYHKRVAINRLNGNFETMWSASQHYRYTTPLDTSDASAGTCKKVSSVPEVKAIL